MTKASRFESRERLALTLYIRTDQWPKNLMYSGSCEPDCFKGVLA